MIFSSFHLSDSKNSSIVITQIKIPPYVILGQTVHLYCLFELRNGTDLYTLKWFKDGAEFYRSVPRASVRKNRRLIFPRPGVKVDFENSKVSCTKSMRWIFTYFPKSKNSTLSCCFVCYFWPSLSFFKSCP